jgi:hypothetical protein
MGILEVHLVFVPEVAHIVVLLVNVALEPLLRRDEDLCVLVHHRNSLGFL